MKIFSFLIILLLCLYIEALPRGVRFGGGRFGRSSGSRRSSWGWGRRSSSPSSSSSSWGRNAGSSNYPRQNWGRNTGSSSYPRQSSGRGGGRGITGGSRTPVGGGGFVRPAPVYRPNPSGVSQYSSFSRPSHSLGRYSAGGKSYGYRAPGYGTNWGTSFPGGVGRYGGGGLSKKALGLGIGAGFLGGAALGMAGTMATYSVYHRYHEFQRMMYMNNPNYGRGWDNGYYNNYYRRNQCMGGCPPNSHCEWGFCECDGGMVRSYGRCQYTQGNPRPPNFDPFVQCTNGSSTCSSLDMNLVCNTNLTTGSVQGRCQCRRDMRWNSEAGECQIYMNVDCSSITYDTPVSETVMSAVEKAKQDMADAAGCPQPNYFCDDGQSCIPSGRVCDGVSDCPQTEVGPGGEEEGECGSGGGPLQQEGGQTPTTTTTANTTVNTVRTGQEAEFQNRTQSKEESLSTSLLTKLDPTKVTPEELTEAFCRDIDAFSFEFQVQNTTVRSTPPPPPPDERPSLLCTKIPSHLCAVAYDSSTCSGGWRLPLPEGQIRFRFWSSWYRYRNDMDTVGVRDGCTFTGHSDSDFNGNSVVIRAQGWDRWAVFERVPQYAHMAEDIESVTCTCRR